MPVVDQRKKLRGNQVVGKFCAEIINDQQIAFEQIPIGISEIITVFVIKFIFGQRIEKSGGTEVDHRMTTFNQLFGNTA